MDAIDILYRGLICIGIILIVAALRLRRRNARADERNRRWLQEREMEERTANNAAYRMDVEHYSK